jgi:hypothetical protein
VKNGKPNMRRKGVRIVEKMTTNYTKWLTNDELDKEWDEVEEVYREWIKTYNGGIKKIRKIMKGNGGRIPEKGKEYWEKIRRIEEKKVDHRKKIKNTKRTEN